MKISSAKPGREREPFSTIVICVNERLTMSSVSCGGSGSIAIADALEAGLKARNLVVEIDRVRCLGLCAKGPNLRFFPGGDWFHEVTADDVPEIVERFETAGNRQ